MLTLIMIRETFHQFQFKNINDKTKSIVFVDCAIIPLFFSLIQNISKEIHITVIHNAFHRLGAKLNGIKTENYFLNTVFSFQSINT